MIGLLKRLGARVALALVGIGASRASTTSQDSRENRVDSVRDVWAVESIEVDIRPVVRLDMHARYKGPRSPLTFNRQVLLDTLEQFIAARTR